MKTKTSVEILLKSLSFTGFPEKRLLLSRNLLTVDLIWPKVGTARKSASRQIVMKKGACDFTSGSLVGTGPACGSLVGTGLACGCDYVIYLPCFGL